MGHCYCYKECETVHLLNERTHIHEGNRVMGKRRFKKASISSTLTDCFSPGIFLTVSYRKFSVVTVGDRLECVVYSQSYLSTSKSSVCGLAHVNGLFRFGLLL